jgi:hypothetical protein
MKEGGIETGGVTNTHPTGICLGLSFIDFLRLQQKK